MVLYMVSWMVMVNEGESESYGRGEAVDTDRWGENRLKGT